MSRFLEALKKAEAVRSAPRVDWVEEPRRFRVVTVTSNKGGVGKTTVATNLAVYFRALREDLPVLVLGFDDQLTLDYMFAFDTERPDVTVVEAMGLSDLSGAIRLGQYGVHYVPSSENLFELKRTIEDPFHLQRVLANTGWEGLVVIDTKSDMEILTRNAIAASDLALVLVSDRSSLRQAERVYDLLAGWGQPRERALIVLSIVDRRIKYAGGTSQDVVALLVAEIRRRGYPLSESFLSRSPLIASLATNPEEQVRPILHSAGGSVVHLQMQHLASDVLRALEDLAGPLPLPSNRGEPWLEPTEELEEEAEEKPPEAGSGALSG